jgi:DNA-binding response OmpR family regulator
MRVLIVEDYAPIRSALAKGLAEAGFAVDIAATGDDGLHLALTEDLDVVILDLMLPGLDGLSLLRRLREAGNPAHVLILTAKDQTRDRIEGLNLGADDYLVKPFDFGELLARVRAMVRRKYGEKNPLLTVGDLEINTSSREVRRASIAIELTAREYALLEFLAMRAGEVVTRTEIWNHVYDFLSDTQSNVVDVYIGYLRRKLERPEWTKLIHTRRGHGYMLGDSS